MNSLKTLLLSPFLNSTVTKAQLTLALFVILTLFPRISHANVCNDLFSSPSLNSKQNLHPLRFIPIDQSSMNYLRLRWSDITLSALSKINDRDLKRDFYRTNIRKPINVPTDLYFVASTIPNLDAKSLETLLRNILKVNTKAKESVQIQWKNQRALIQIQHLSSKTLLQILESDYVQQVFTSPPSEQELLQDWRFNQPTSRAYYERIQDVLLMIQKLRRQTLQDLKETDRLYKEFKTHASRPIVDPLFPNLEQQGNNENLATSWRAHQEQRDFVLETLQRNLKEIDDFIFDLQALALTETY